MEVHDRAAETSTKRSDVETATATQKSFFSAFARYEDLFAQFLEAHKAFKETGTEFSPESKKMVKLINQLAFQREEVWLQSRVEDVTSADEMTDGAIYCDLKSNMLFTEEMALPEGPDVEDLIAGKLLVRLTPLELAAEVQAKRDRIWEKLSDQNPGKRLTALRQLKDMLDSKELSVRAVEDIFVHCHTTESYSPYTVELFVARAALLGIHRIGIVDHETLCGAQEFAKACETMGISATVFGMERRFTMPRDIEYNSPLNQREAYWAGHGGPKNAADIVDSEEEREVRAEKIIRLKETIAHLNSTRALSQYGIALDYKADVEPLTERGKRDPENANPTERHLARAISEKIFQACEIAEGKSDPVRVAAIFEELIAECRKDVSGSALSPKVKDTICKGEALTATDGEKMTDPARAMIVARDKIVKALRQLHAPSVKENVPAKEGIAKWHARGFEAFYLVLDGETCEAETPENLPALIAELKELGADGVGLIINRINDLTLMRLMNVFEKPFGRTFIINGLDVNDEGMPFTYVNNVDFLAATERLVRRKTA